MIVSYDPEMCNVFYVASDTVTVTVSIENVDNCERIKLVSSKLIRPLPNPISVTNVGLDYPHIVETICELTEIEYNDVSRETLIHHIDALYNHVPPTQI